MREKQVLFIASECRGFVETGGLADVIGSLPQAIMASDDSYKVSVVLPLYREIYQKFKDELKFLGDTKVALSWRKQYCGVYSLTLNQITYYFIENKYYFDRDNIYGHFDDGERFAFFSKSIFEIFPIIGFTPDIIHTHDWHTALVNVYLDINYKKQGLFTDIKSVFTIHNLQFQGIYELSFLYDIIGISAEYQDIIEYNGLVNFVKGAIVCSDLVSTVSPRYAREICTAQYAFGLENITRVNNHKIIGILNGINEEYYNPETDDALDVRYNQDNLILKAKNKVSLQKELNLEIDSNTCLISLISRLTLQKGLDLIIECFDELIKEDVQFVFLGKGEKIYEEKLLYFQRKYPGKVSSLITYDSRLSKKIYGSSDLFLMPSKTEPCGLSQMIASRYGTVPIVRATGGLYDSIKDYQNGKGNGFVLRDYSADALSTKIKEALALYNKKEDFLSLSKKIMGIDFSWSRSSKSYIKMYQKLLEK